MQPKLLDRKVKVKIPTAAARRHEIQEYCDAEMSIRDAIKAGYLSDSVVALQIFEQLENQ